MQLYWSKGIDEDGETQLLGPFEIRDMATSESEIAGLRGVTVFEAPDRNSAMRAAQSGGSRSTLSADEPMPAVPAFRAREDNEELQ